MVAVEARAYVGSLMPIQLGHRVPETEASDWLIAALKRSAEDLPPAAFGKAVRLHERLAGSSQIDARVTCLEDYTHQNWSQMRLFRAHDGNGAPWYRPPLEERMKVYAQAAHDAATRAFCSDSEPPDYIVQVSCTGYDAPTAVQKVAIAKGWEQQTRLLMVGHLGCYASVPVSNMATDLLAGRARLSSRSRARISLLFCELCTLHVRLETTDPGQIVQQRLFADGAIRVDVTLEHRPGSFAFLDSFEAIIPDTVGSMSWSLADSAFDMFLGPDVPRVLQARLEPVVSGFLDRHGLSVEDVNWFAIHPGGPRIIEASAASLGVGPEAIRHSLGVFRERGNMSSCSLPHVWHAIMQDPTVPEGDLVCSLAFGPGLTVAGCLLRKGL